MRESFFHLISMMFGYNAQENLKYFNNETIQTIINDPLYKDRGIYRKDEIQQLLMKPVMPQD